MKIMTYEEYRETCYNNLSGWRKFTYRMSSAVPDWRPYYYKWVLKCILKSESLEEAKEKANTALGR